MLNFGYRVFLDAVNPDSQDQLRQWRNDPRINSWCRQVGLISQMHQDRWFRAQAEDETMRMFCVRNDEKELVGMTGLTSICFINSRAEFSLYIAPEHQGNGYAKGALQSICHFGFKHLGLNSIFGESFEGNTAIDVFKEVGFKFEGVRRAFYFKNGSHINAILLSMLKSEFENEK